MSTPIDIENKSFFEFVKIALKAMPKEHVFKFSMIVVAAFLLMTGIGVGGTFGVAYIRERSPNKANIDNAVSAQAVKSDSLCDVRIAYVEKSYKIIIAIIGERIDNMKPDIIEKKTTVYAPREIQKIDECGDVETITVLPKKTDVEIRTLRKSNDQEELGKEIDKFLN